MFLWADRQGLGGFFRRWVKPLGSGLIYTPRFFLKGELEMKATPELGQGIQHSASQSKDPFPARGQCLVDQGDVSTCRCLGAF